MNKKALVLVLMVVLLLVAAGAVSAGGVWDDAIQMQVDTTLDVYCQGGYIDADIVNNSFVSVAHITCYSYFPPR